MNGFRPSRAWPRFLDGPGAGGAWKASPDDFVVEEIPLVEPTGEGEHQWLRVEKVGRTTMDAAMALARAAGVSADAVGYAGLKDRDARTVQDFTVQLGRPIETLPEGFRILARAQTRRRLRVGQLRGNRFTLNIRGGDVAVARDRLERLRETGCPNYYGAQRVGGPAPEEGRMLLLGRGGRLRHRELKFALSAYQSLLFNRVLARRGRRRLDGDLVFTGEEEGEARFRLAAPDESEPPTGPIFGARMVWPEGEARALEAEVLAAEGLPADAWRRFGSLTLGTRRRLWFPVDAELTPTVDGFVIRVALPAGSYATELLEEVL